MRRQILYVTLPVCLAIVVAGAWLANAGDLNPPAGPVTPTMLTLDDLASAIQSISGGDARTDVLTLPGSASALHVIDQPGSYYLSANITGVSGKNGIEIAADFVTFDLNGFSLLGITGSLAGVIVPPPGYTGIAIRSGTISRWGNHGVMVQAAINSFLNDLRASENGGGGLRIGTSGTVQNCIASSNTGIGIQTDWGCAVSNCVARSNSSDGIFGGSGTTITNCAAAANSNDGIRGGQGGPITHCVAMENGRYGISVDIYGLASDCAANLNAVIGINAAEGTTVQNCAAGDNTGNGIRVASGSIVIGCTVYNNGDATNAGIEANGPLVRIEGNNVHSNNGDGIESDGQNVIIKNSAKNNATDYNVHALDMVGPILTATGTITNANPWANFSFP